MMHAYAHRPLVDQMLIYCLTEATKTRHMTKVEELARWIVLVCKVTAAFEPFVRTNSECNWKRLNIADTKNLRDEP